MCVFCAGVYLPLEMEVKRGLFDNREGAKK